MIDHAEIREASYLNPAPRVETLL